MKKKLIYTLLFIVTCSAITIFAFKKPSLSAKLEVLEVKENGVAVFKLTNTGCDAFFEGYGSDNPLSLIDKKKNESWVLGSGPWCGTGLGNHKIKSGESIIFEEKAYEYSGKWRIRLDISDSNYYRNSWYDEMLRFLKIEKEFKSLELTSTEITTVLPK